MNIATVPCKCCEGSGKQIDHRQLGKDLRNRRLLLHMMASEVARSMGISRSHIAQLEKGELHWTAEQLEAYEGALADRSKAILEAAKTTTQNPK